MLRRAGLAAVAGAATAIGANTVVWLAEPSVPDDRLSYPLTAHAFAVAQVWFAATQLLMAIGVLGLTRSGIAGTGRAASRFGAVAVLGMALRVPGELILIAVASRDADSGAVSAASSLFGIGVLTADVGLIGLGVLAVRGRRWPQPWVVLPLALGLFELLVATPVSLSLGFASTASYVVIVIADLLVALLGLALIRTTDGVQPEAGRSALSRTT